MQFETISEIYFEHITKVYFVQISKVYFVQIWKVFDGIELIDLAAESSGISSLSLQEEPRFCQQSLLTILTMIISYILSWSIIPNSVYPDWWYHNSHRCFYLQTYLDCFSQIWYLKFSAACSATAVTTIAPGMRSFHIRFWNRPHF